MPKIHPLFIFMRKTCSKDLCITLHQRGYLTKLINKEFILEEKIPLKELPPRLYRTLSIYLNIQKNNPEVFTEIIKTT